MDNKLIRVLQDICSELKKIRKLMERADNQSERWYEEDGK